MIPITDHIMSHKLLNPRPFCAFLYDLNHLKGHVNGCAGTLPSFCKLFYAVKANSEDKILRTLAPLVHGFEVASLGEILKVRAVSADIPVIFGGPGKTDHDIEEGIKQKVRLFHAESEHELLRIGQIAAKRGICVSVLLRVNLRGPLPDATLSMAGPSTQFGIDEDQVPQIIALAKSLPSVKLEGFHLHSISNNLDFQKHLNLIRYYCQRVKQWAGQFDLSVSYLNAGGGLGVNYSNLNGQFDWASFVDGLNSSIQEELPAGVALIFECGRYLTSSCGYYAAEVLDMKQNHGKNYIIIRGGTHHFRLPVSWQHNHPFTVVPVERWEYPFARKELADSSITIAGELCTPKDVLARDVSVARVRIGDIIVFLYAGAYGWAISHHDFLSHPHPAHIYAE